MNRVLNANLLFFILFTCKRITFLPNFFRFPAIPAAISLLTTQNSHFGLLSLSPQSPYPSLAYIYAGSGVAAAPATPQPLPAPA